MNDENTNAPLETIRVWTPLATALYALLIAFPAALIPAVKTWRKLGMYREAGMHVLGAFALALPLMGIMYFSERRTSRVFTFALNFAAFSYLKAKLQSDIAAATRANPALRVEYRPWYSAIPWALLGLFFFLILAMIVIMTLEAAGVPGSD